MERKQASCLDPASKLVSSVWRKWAGNNHPAWGRPGHQAGWGGWAGRPALGTNFWNSGVSRRHSLHPGTHTTQLAGGTASQLLSTPTALLQTKCPISFLTAHLGTPVLHPPPSIHQVFKSLSLSALLSEWSPKCSLPQSPSFRARLNVTSLVKLPPFLRAGSDSCLLLALGAL